MPINTRPLADHSREAWYCVQTAPKQENKVAGLLARDLRLEVFAPKIRFRRNRAGKPIWWTEALFPGYLFTRFDYFQSHRQIRALSGVATIVQFGSRPTPVGEGVMSALRGAIGDGDTVEVTGLPESASEVLVIHGPLRGLRLLLTRVMSSGERVRVLFEILGAEREVELRADAVVAANPRAQSRM